MSNPKFQIDLRRLSDEGAKLAGSEPKEFFALSAKDSIQSVDGLQYDLHAIQDDDELVITGTLEARFSVECGRCLKPVEIDVILDPYDTSLEIGEGVETIDLTEAVREDILLALPSYPRCEDGNVEARECSEQGRFEATASPQEGESGESAGVQDRHVWDVLDQLKNR
jgi:uncharacterized protein